MPHRSSLYIVVNGSGKAYMDETGSKFLPMPLLHGDAASGYARPDGAHVAGYEESLAACKEARLRLDDAAHLVQLEPSTRGVRQR